MKKQFFALLCAATLGSLAQQARASVVVSNLDPANPPFGEISPEIGQSLLTGNRPISLTSVQFLQTGGATAGESFAVYSRNADGTLGTSLFTGFTVGFDSASSDSTATVNSGTSFILQANTGYFFVLNGPSGNNISWTYTSSTDYAAAFGATLPNANTAFFSVGGTLSYRSLTGTNGGPQEFQVNGSALPAVPEPSALAFIGLTLAGGVVVLARRRPVAA